MDIVWYCICAATLTAFLVMNARKALHMFQLNSYKPATHLRWLKRNLTCLIPGVVVAVAAVVAVFLSAATGAAVLAAVSACACVAVWPKKAKKPLVYTQRVIRQIITLAVLVALAAVCAWLTGDWFIVASVVAAVSPLLILAVFYINKPVENAINRWFINDAKRILKSCPDLKVIGVTGSYGKTSVKFILKTLLAAKYNVLATPESYNTPMGVVITVRNFLRPTHEVFVCEMGARHVGDIKELCDIVHPQNGIITSVGPQHLETFHSLDNVKKTKFELADALPEEGVVFLNGEDANIEAHRSNVKGKAISYGLSDKCDYYATDISASSRGTSFTVHTPKGETETFTAAMIGKHNVINILGGIAVACEMGIRLAALKPQVRKLESVSHRLQLLPKGNGVTVIDDAYNANPAGTKAAIDALALFDGFKVLVTPGMVELGDKQDELNKEFGAYAAKVCDYVILVGKKQAVPIREGLLEAGYPEDKIYVAEALGDAITRAYGVSAGGREKVILLENDLPDNF